MKRRHVVLCAFIALLMAACTLDGDNLLGPAGGFVFYDKGSYSEGWRYLEAAPENVGRGTWSKAKQLCEEYSYGGYDNWRLPDIEDELEALLVDFKNKQNDHADLGYYWSSTETSSTGAWAIKLISNNEIGEPFNASKTGNSFWARPVRQF